MNRVIMLLFLSTIVLFSADISSIKSQGVIKIGVREISRHLAVKTMVS